MAPVNWFRSAIEKLVLVNIFWSAIEKMVLVHHVPARSNLQLKISSGQHLKVVPVKIFRQ
jgi:hypothetical protein